MLKPNSSLDKPAMRNQGVVGRVLTRHVGLKPDLRSNEQSGLNLQCVAVKRGIELLCGNSSVRLNWRVLAEKSILTRVPSDS